MSNLLLTSSKFDKWVCQRKQPVQAHRVSASCSLWKIYKCLLHQTVRKVMLLLVNNALEKTPQKGKTEEILKACVCDL